MTADGPDEDPTPATVAHRMADAVTYLSQVADDAGLCRIAVELRSVRRSLLRKVKEGNEPTETPGSGRAASRRHGGR
jgi:hypothetical protein